MFFGLVRKTESTVASKYSVRTYPTLILLKQGQKPIKYKGAMKYKEIFEFMNTYSETFNFAEADISDESIASKPWMSDPFPEMNEESKDDICYKKEGLCVILFTESTPTEAQKSMINEVRENTMTKLDDRGIKFSFMWIDAAHTPEIAKSFKIEKFPQVAVLNHGKNKKFMLNDELSPTSVGISSLLNKISGGDGRFKKI